MNLLAVVWDFDPTLFTIFGFEIRWYSLTWVAALLFGGWLFSYFCKREGKSQGVSDTAFLYIALGTILGARIGHCLFYEPMEYLQAPWKIITGIRDGGLASHGAAIGIILGIWLSSRKNNISVWWTADRLGIIAPLSGAFIRFGNLFNSEIFGCVTDLPWRFQFINATIYKRNYAEYVENCKELGQDPAKYYDWAIENVPFSHPTQIYEALSYIVVFAILFVLYRYTKVAERKGFIFGAAMVGIFVPRFIIEFIKLEQVSNEIFWGLNRGQWLSVPFIVVGVAIMIWAWFRHKNEPAVAEPKAQNSNEQKNKRHFKK